METLQLAMQDWTRDIKHSSTSHVRQSLSISARCDSSQLQSMDARAFIESMFELTDIWTTTTEESEYIHFLATLYHRITKVRWGKLFCPRVALQTNGRAELG